MSNDYEPDDETIRRMLEWDRELTRIAKMPVWPRAERKLRREASRAFYQSESGKAFNQWAVSTEGKQFLEWMETDEGSREWKELKAASLAGGIK